MPESTRGRGGAAAGEGADDMAVIVSKVRCNRTGCSGVESSDSMAREEGRVGDEAFVEAIYTASYRRLVGQLSLICGDLATAEDIVSEAFVRAVVDRRRRTWSLTQAAEPAGRSP